MGFLFPRNAGAKEIALAMGNTVARMNRIREHLVLPKWSWQSGLRMLSDWLWMNLLGFLRLCDRSRRLMTVAWISSLWMKDTGS